MGGSAQTKAMKSVAGRMKIDLAQFRELAAFAQFSSDLDPATKAQIERGRRLTEILKQSTYSPVPLAEEVVIIWATTNGHLDDIPVEKIKSFEAEFIKMMRLKNKKLLEEIMEKKVLEEKLIKDLEKITKDFVKEFQKQK